jgi:hypothetical protein
MAALIATSYARRRRAFSLECAAGQKPTVYVLRD